jgi:glutamate--cysteine ligase
VCPPSSALNDAVAEPVVCMIDRYVVGGFYRIHASRGSDENLARPGLAVRAAGLCREATTCRVPGVKPGASAPNRFYMYGVIGRLAMLAASLRAGGHRPQHRQRRLRSVRVTTGR